MSITCVLCLGGIDDAVGVLVDGVEREEAVPLVEDVHGGGARHLPDLAWGRRWALWWGRMEGLCPLE